MPLHDGKVGVVHQTTLRPLMTAVLAFILFYCIDFVLRNYLSVFPKSGDCNAFTRLRNYMLSTIHALSSGMSAFGCLVLCQRLTDDIIAAENEYAYHILGFSTGIFSRFTYASRLLYS
ncbi:hypothetical protein PHET_08946 [Paragonimus heterotremus]|uniref:TLC domain-containing protein n=1 Tax=Paragonimus heterotremus TaxID=100268 RepID=A0A8J4SLX8_9TREM|nr:hypothetical protein PHET_08946 [Paragonimus heterotremus]